LLHLRIDDRSAIVQIEMLRGRAFRLVHGGVVRHARVLSPRAAELLVMMPAKQRPTPRAWCCRRCRGF